MPSRTDRWNEDFEITVDKASEVEIAVYDKQVSETHPTPIALLWIKISDLVEAQRRQKVLMETQGQGGWVTAGAMDGDNPMLGGSMSGDMNSPLNQSFAAGGPPGSGQSLSREAEGIDSWFACEPAGALALHVSFSMFLLTYAILTLL